MAPGINNFNEYRFNKGINIELNIIKKKEEKKPLFILILP